MKLNNLSKNINYKFNLIQKKTNIIYNNYNMIMII